MLTSFLKQQLEKPAKDSKKWRMAMLGLKGIAGFFISGCVMFFIIPALAPHITTLVQFALTAWGGVVSIYLGAQGTVDFKTTAALQNTQEDNKEEHIIQDQHIFNEGSPGAPEIRPFSQPAILK